MDRSAPGPSVFVPTFLIVGWDHRALTQAEEELKWGVAISPAAGLPFYLLSTQSLGLCPVLPPSPSPAATTF